MSVPWPGSMSGSQVKNPLLLLLFLLLLNAGTVLCQDTEDADDGDPTTEEVDVSQDSPVETSAPDPLPDDPETTPAMDPPAITDETQVDYPSVVDLEPGSGTEPSAEDSTTTPTEEESLNPIVILIPVGLVLLIIPMIVAGIFINRKCNRKGRKKGLKEEDPYLDGSPSEKVPMPMFEEDVPSVLELEMEELDQWMQQDGEATKESMQT